MRIPYFIFSEKQMYSSAIKSVMEDVKKRAAIVDTTVDLKHALEDVKGSIVIIGPHLQKDPYKVCQDLSLNYPASAILLVLNKQDIDYKKAMFSGALDILDIECEESELIESVQKAEEIVKLKVEGNLDLNDEGKKAKVVTVCSTKGGVGKTTISVNIAAALNKKNLKVAVLDLDLQFGDVSLLFDQQPSLTIYDWVKQSYENGDKSFKRYMTKHSSGVEILAAPTLPEFAEMITGEHIAYLIEAMKKEYDIIIIDTPPSFVETSLVALENSDDILLIVSMDLPALKNGKLAVETLNLLELKDKIKIILNRDTASDGITKEVVEEVLAMKIKGTIPSDYPTVISSVNRGTPFVTMAPRTPVAKSLMKISEQLVTAVPLESEKVEVKKNRRSLFKKKK